MFINEFFFPTERSVEITVPFVPGGERPLGSGGGHGRFFWVGDIGVLCGHVVVKNMVKSEMSIQTMVLWENYRKTIGKWWFNGI